MSEAPIVWDLYGGAGVFAAAALDAIPDARVTVVESASGSLAAATATLGSAEGIRTVRSRVETFLEGGEEGADGAVAREKHDDDGVARGGVEVPDIVILDPPRGGAGIPVMEALAATTRSRIVHVGCDPASLARDVGVLVASGWSLRDFRGVSAFPGTHHVEGIAVLDAPGRD